MNAQARDYWQRALQAVKTAKRLESEDPDATANRAYYAAFYAVSALFALENKRFSKHSAVAAALHRDLVNTGRWEKERGAEYSFLLQLRDKGDYGGDKHVSLKEAEKAVKAAQNIIRSIKTESDEFSEIEDQNEGDL
jgi:uncharacterized protein (UPF0332 family)